MIGRITLVFSHDRQVIFRLEMAKVLIKRLRRQLQGRDFAHHVASRCSVNSMPRDSTLVVC